MTTSGLIIGAATFLAIGAFHPLVIKAEYHWGASCWWAFLLLGVGCIGASLFCPQVVSILLGVIGFSSLWSIHELLKQRTRVEKGWFPAGPGHQRHQQRREKKHGNGGKRMLSVVLLLTLACVSNAQTYVGTLTIGNYQQKEVEVRLKKGSTGEHSLVLYNTKFARMMPVKLDVELQPIEVKDAVIQGDNIVPTARKKRYEKHTVHHLRGRIESGAMRFKCRMGEKQLVFEGKRK